MITENPWLQASRGCFAHEVKDFESRRTLINNMDREQLTAALSWDDTHRALKTVIKRRLKQFDEWGYELSIRFRDGRIERTHKQGNARQVRRWAMMKSLACEVFDLSPAITREEWLRCYGDGKTRM